MKGLFPALIPTLPQFLGLTSYPNKDSLDLRTLATSLSTNPQMSKHTHQSNTLTQAKFSSQNKSSPQVKSPSASQVKQKQPKPPLVPKLSSTKPSLNPSAKSYTYSAVSTQETDFEMQHEEMNFKKRTHSELFESDPLPEKAKPISAFEPDMNQNDDFDIESQEIDVKHDPLTTKRDMSHLKGFGVNAKDSVKADTLQKKKVVPKKEVKPPPVFL